MLALVAVASRASNNQNQMMLNAFVFTVCCSSYSVDLLQVPVPGISGSLFPILVFSYFDGPSLSTHYSNPRYARGMDLEESLPLSLQLAEIVAAIHSQGVLHRDISASNILYAPDTREARIIDFGISTSFPTLANQAAHIAKQLQGTLLYLSPEQTGRIGRIVDHRSDIYSLGVCLYQV
jgi:serine/threonine protein kinase